MGDKNVAFLICSKPLKPEFSNLQKICISSADFKIGRDLKNSIVIPFLTISRHHCIIRKTNYNAWFIEDLSTFGIKINGVPLGRGNKKRLKHRDIICLEPSYEFIYVFEDPFHRSNDNSFEVPKKRMKSENSDDSTDAINNENINILLSQTFEMTILNEKIQNTKQMQEQSLSLKNHLQTEMDDKVKTLQNNYTTQIESLKGEKSVVVEQKALLRTERDTKIATLKKEMEEKISKLKAQIDQHNITECKLTAENSFLKLNFFKERYKFLSELDKESSSKHDMLDKLEAKIYEQEKFHLKEKKELQETLQKEIERLNIAKEQELKLLEEQKKSRELELLHELDILKNSNKSKVEETETEHQIVSKMDKTENLSPENKDIVEKLVKEREDLQKKLVDAKIIADKSLTEIETRVQDRETELAALAADRIHICSEQTTEVINSLLEQLDKVKKQLKTLESEKDMLKATNKTVEISTKINTVAEFTNIMESELQCSICSELFINATTLNCSHTFCKFCIKKWQKKKKDCPICRRYISSECKSIVLDSFIEKVVENMSVEMKQRRLDMLKLRKDTPRFFREPNKENEAEDEAATMTKSNQISMTSGNRRTRRATRTSTASTSGQDNTAQSLANRVPTVDLTT